MVVAAIDVLVPNTSKLQRNSACTTQACQLHSGLPVACLVKRDDRHFNVAQREG
jgi:hypothetical protein